MTSGKIQLNGHILLVWKPQGESQRFSQVIPTIL